MCEAQEFSLLTMASAAYIPAYVVGIVFQIREKLNSEGVLYGKTVLEQDKNSMVCTLAENT